MIKSKDTLKTYFETGDIPTESQFTDLIDSLRHIQDGQVIVSHTTDGSGNTVITLSDGRKISIVQSNSNHQHNQIQHYINYRESPNQILHGYDSDGKIASSNSVNYRKILASGVYSYWTYNGNIGAPVGYGAAIGFGAGANGTVEILGEWSGGGGDLWTRSLRDCCQNWSEWRKIWTSGNHGNGSGLDADKLDGLDSSEFIRSNNNDTFTAMLSVGSTNQRQAGIYGIYDSYKTAHIWSIGTGYKINTNGNDFGNLYGFGYKHTNNKTGGTMAGGHQAVWCENGNPKVAIGENIWTAGNIIASGNVTAYSDKRLKNILEPVKDSFLDKIDKLKPTYYQWKDTTKEQTKQLGFIAQEVMEVFPEWVHKSNEHYAMSYDKMGAVLAVKGTQELRTEMDRLRTELKELKAELKELKNGITK